jgi:complement component 1 Q subcomponent-binding protein
MALLNAERSCLRRTSELMAQASPSSKESLRETLLTSKLSSTRPSITNAFDSPPTIQIAQSISPTIATMLSLRAAFRAAPRTATRVASQSTTSSLRPAFQRTLQTRINSQLPRIAAFSTTRSRFDENSQQLAIKLDSEIKIETEESNVTAGSDTNVDAFLAENPDWTIEDTAGEQDVFITRTYEDETITVHFSIADFNSQMMGDEDMDTAMADEEDMEMQSHGANTKGSINQGGTANRNFKVAPEDSIAPADREELQDEVRHD